MCSLPPFNLQGRITAPMMTAQVRELQAIDSVPLTDGFVLQCPTHETLTSFGMRAAHRCRQFYIERVAAGPVVTASSCRLCVFTCIFITVKRDSEHRQLTLHKNPVSILPVSD